MRKIHLSVCLAILALALPQRTQAEDVGVVKLSDRTPAGKQVKSTGLIGRSSIQLASYLKQEHELPHPPMDGAALPEPAPVAGPVAHGQPCQHCNKVHAPAPVYCEEPSRGIPVCCLPGCCLPGCCLPCGVHGLGSGFASVFCKELSVTNCKDGTTRLQQLVAKCNTSGRFGYFNHDGYPCLDPLGCYGMVYPVNPQYFDKRDGQIYAAPHYGIPMAVPLAPTVGKTYNYGWGIPSSRLTPVAHSYHWTYGGPISSTGSSAYPPDYPYDHNYWVPPHDYYRKLNPVKVTAPPLRMSQAYQRTNPTQLPITHGQPTLAQPAPAQPAPAQPAPAQPAPDVAPGFPVDLPPAP